MSATNGDDHVRIFIISPGRTGSTLLAWILARAGADFALPIPERWDARMGELEHPQLVRAARAFGASHQISGDKPRTLLPRLSWTLHRHSARRNLARVLTEARYLKSEDLDLAVQPAFALGYLPRVVLSCRRFEEQALSRFQRQTYASVEWLEAYYLRVCKNALLQLGLYGGCSVGYHELVDFKARSWAGALATVSGLDEQALLAAREEVVRGPVGPLAGHNIEPISSTEGEKVYTQMAALSGHVLAPSAQALRNWKPRTLSISQG